MVATAEELSLAKKDAIAHGDTVLVDVAGQDDLSASYKVDDAGRVTLPFGGSVIAAGLTTDELEQALISNLKPDYLINPRISVKLVDESDEPVQIDGSEHAQVRVQSLRVRSGPSRVEPTVDGLARGTYVIVTDRSEGWCAVATARERTPKGWVACRLLTMTPDASVNIDHD